MAFNICVIIGIVIQGLIIIWLAKQCVAHSFALAAMLAYFQALATDLGYPKIVENDDVDSDELQQWVHAKKDTNGDT